MFQEEIEKNGTECLRRVILYLNGRKIRIEENKSVTLKTEYLKLSSIISHSSRHRRPIQLNRDIFPSGVPGWAPRLHRRLGSTMDQTKDPGSHDHALSPPPLRSAVDGGNAFTKLPLSTGNSSSRSSFHSVCIHTRVAGRGAYTKRCIARDALRPLPPSPSLFLFEAIINGRLRVHQRNAGDVLLKMHTRWIVFTVTLPALSNF